MQPIAQVNQMEKLFSTTPFISWMLEVCYILPEVDTYIHIYIYQQHHPYHEQILLFNKIG